MLSEVFLTTLLAAGAAQAPDVRLSIMVSGAHPDDAEKSGGTMAKFIAAGHRVRLVSLTNGDAGHQSMGGGVLAKRRTAEAKCAGRVIGADYVVLDNHDGELEVTLERRREVIRLIREFEADVVITHRPNDYHPDHRNTGLLVRDAAFMVTVPNIVPAVAHLQKNPIFLYMSDRFTKPAPFRADVVVAIDGVIEKKIDMYHCHESQMYEWLPYNAGYLDQVPSDVSQRRAWLGEVWKPRSSSTADRFRAQLAERYGEGAGEIRYAEAFELSEYGSQPDLEDLRALFPR